MGYRTRSTLKSDEAWYEAHRKSAWSVYASALVFFTGAIVSFTTNSATYARVLVFCGVVTAVLVGGFHASRVGRRTDSRMWNGGHATSLN